MSDRSSDRTARRKRRNVFRSTAVVLIFLLFVLLLTAAFWGLGQLASRVPDEDAASTTATTEQTTTTAATTARPTVPALDASALDAAINAKRVIVYNVTYDTVVYSKNADDICAPASTTKLLTAAIAVRLGDMTEPITIGEEIKLVKDGSSLAKLQVGQTLTLPQLLDALLIPSGNDAAYALAAYIGRKLAPDAADLQAAVDAFVAEMNRQAKELGCISSHFMNPDGMTAEGHQTTARDMLLIARHANTFTAIRQCVMKSAVSTEIDGKTVYWKNSNEMIHPANRYHYTYIIGTKTGFTTPAGYCLVGTANRIGEEVITVVMGADSSDDRFRDTKTLFEAAFAHNG